MKQRLGNTFTAEEVTAMVNFFRAVERDKFVRHLTTSQTLRGVRAKFVRMDRQLALPAAERAPTEMNT